MPRDTPVCLLPDELARRDAVLDALPDAEWTHLACHGEFNRHAPHLSALMLTDGKLTLAELQQCRLRMRLAVLASCWSSTAAVLPGNEMVCLPGAFLRAGARAVLASLWELDDKTNFRFMRDYYPAALRDGPVDGLAAVQRAWARSPEREKRMALRWAAYTVYGS